MSLASLLRHSSKRLLWGCCVSAAQLAFGTAAHAATPTVEQALGLTPMQKEIEYDRPTGDDVAKCTIQVEKNGTVSGWVVKDPEGRILRRFIDTNGDNTVDQWSYFADGLEVYRDVDSNSNGKADQYRWLNTGGSRWALDTNEDGKLDAWKQISAEEVSAEAVQAMATRDAARFQRLLLTTDELKTLGLGDKYGAMIGEKVAAAPQRFTGLTNDSKIANASTGSAKWLNFSGTRPGLVPAGTDGTTKDVLVYENVAAMMEVGEKAAQVQIGTMIRVGDVWRLIDVPSLVGEKAELADSGVFFNSPLPAQSAAGPGTDSVAGKEIFNDLDELDAKIEKAASKDERSAAKTKRADLIEQLLPTLKEDEDRALWTRQLVDTLSEGVQTRTNPDFLKRLKDLEKKLSDDGRKELVPYVRYGTMMSEYMLATSDPQGGDFVKIQAKWLEDLQNFVKEFPSAVESADALLHLAIDAEYSGREDAAKQLYSAIGAKFPQAAQAKKATGAVRRLDSVGKPMTLAGTTTDGKPFDLKSLGGKPVIVYYWASTGATTDVDVGVVKAVQAKYARDVTVVGISLDFDQNELASYLQRQRLPWVNLFEKGGTDNRFANEMGILTYPTIVLVDATGKVANRSVHITELDREVGNLVKR